MIRSPYYEKLTRKAKLFTDAVLAGDVRVQKSFPLGYKWVKKDSTNIKLVFIDAVAGYNPKEMPDRNHDKRHPCNHRFSINKPMGLSMIAYYQKEALLELDTNWLVPEIVEWMGKKPTGSKERLKIQELGQEMVAKVCAIQRELLPSMDEKGSEHKIKAYMEMYKMHHGEEQANRILLVQSYILSQPWMVEVAKIGNEALMVEIGKVQERQRDYGNQHSDYYNNGIKLDAFSEYIQGILRSQMKNRLEVKKKHALESSLDLE